MWCIGALTEEYRQRMYDLLDLYARPFHSKEPVVCLDEKSKQLLKDSRPSLPIQPGSPAKQDYEYDRAGTCNLFVAVEPKGGRRTVIVTDHRAKTDFVAFVQHLLKQVYVTARRIHPDVIVLGGGMSNIERLYIHIPELWKRWVFSDRVDTKLVQHRFGDSSGVRGAAWL